jgi:hypothetical protein
MFLPPWISGDGRRRREDVGVQIVSSYWLESLVSFVVWLVANVVYLDMKRSGTRGLRRLVAFWLGSPTTWASMIFLPEGSSIQVEPPPDDEEALLAEIRRDRRLRSGPDEEEADRPPPPPSPSEDS